MRWVAVISFLFVLAGGVRAEPIKHRVKGLFDKQRESELRQAFESMPDIKLVSIDFENAEAVLDYDPVKLFPRMKPEEMVRKLDERLGGASQGTFGIKPLRSVALDKLKRVEISIVGLDCRACALVAYQAICEIEGVETATVSFREGRIGALINPEKTDQKALEEALKKKGVELKSK